LFQNLGFVEEDWWLVSFGLVNMSASSSKSKTKNNEVIFNWPMPRQEWITGKFIEHHEKNDEGWVELFIDLIYVVLLSSLSNQFESVESASVQLFFKVSLSFWIICLTRQAIDEYSNRFYCHDFVQKCIYFVYTIAVFIQASATQFDYLHQAEGSGAAVHHSHVHSSGTLLESEPHEAEGSHGGGIRHSRIYSSGFAISVIITRVCLLLSKSFSSYTGVVVPFR
jgi:hypothetical protein